MKEEIRTKFYWDLGCAVESCLLSDGPFFIVGDFNAKLGKNLIPNGCHIMSHNGKKYEHLLQYVKLRIM